MEYPERLAPLAALALVVLALLATLIAVVNVVGRKLNKHAEWLRLIDLKLGNLHKDKQAAYVRSLQVTGTPRPPPLSEARTVEVTEEMLLKLTQDVSELKETRKRNNNDGG